MGLGSRMMEVPATRRFESRVILILGGSSSIRLLDGTFNNAGAFTPRGPCTSPAPLGVTEQRKIAP